VPETENQSREISALKKDSFRDITSYLYAKARRRFRSASLRAVRSVQAKRYAIVFYVDFLPKIALAGTNRPITKSTAPTMKVMLLMVGWK
jgi:hypothetical protein